MGFSLSSLDPTNKNSAVRSAARNSDPTNRNGNLRRALRAGDTTNPDGLLRSGLRDIDVTDPDSAIRQAFDKLGNKISGLGGNGSETITQVPWEEQQAYLRTLFGNAKDLLDSEDPLNPGFSERTQTGLDTLYNRGANGSDLEQGGADALTGLLAGGTNPGTDLAMDGINASNAGNQGLMSEIDSVTGRVGGAPGSDMITGGVNRSNTVTDSLLGNVQGAMGRIESSPGNSYITGGMNASNAGARDIMGSMDSLVGRGANAPGNTAINDVTYGDYINPETAYLRGRLANGSLQDTQSQGLLGETATGGFMNNNPHLDATFNKAADAVSKNFNRNIMPNINAMFSKSGRTGSNAHTEMFKDEVGNLKGSLNNLATDIYGGAYDTERGYMENAKGTLANVNAQGMNRELGAAQSLGSNFQNNLNTRMTGGGMLNDQFNTSGNFDLNALNSKNSVVNSNVGNQFTGGGLLNDDFRAGTDTLLSGAQTSGNLLGQDVGNTFAGGGLLNDQYNTDTNTLMTGVNAKGNLLNQDVSNTFQGSNIVSNNYDSGQNRTLDAVGMVPTYSGMDYNNINAMIGAGGAQDDLNNKQAMEPWQKLGLYQGAVTGNYGGTTTQPSQGGGGILGSIGTGLTGWAMTGNPWAGLAAGTADYLRNR